MHYNGYIQLGYNKSIQSRLYAIEKIDHFQYFLNGGTHGVLIWIIQLLLYKFCTLLIYCFTIKKVSNCQIPKVTGK